MQILLFYILSCVWCSGCFGKLIQCSIFMHTMVWFLRKNNDGKNTENCRPGKRRVTGSRTIFSLHEKRPEPDSITNLTCLDGKIYSKAAEVEEFITISHPDYKVKFCRRPFSGYSDSVFFRQVFCIDIDFLNGFCTVLFTQPLGLNQRQSHRISYFIQLSACMLAYRKMRHDMLKLKFDTKKSLIYHLLYEIKNIELDYLKYSRCNLVHQQF